MRNNAFRGGGDAGLVPVVVEPMAHGEVFHLHLVKVASARLGAARALPSEGGGARPPLPRKRILGVNITCVISPPMTGVPQHRRLDSPTLRPVLGLRIGFCLNLPRGADRSGAERREALPSSSARLDSGIAHSPTSSSTLAHPPQQPTSPSDPAPSRGHSAA